MNTKMPSPMFWEKAAITQAMKKRPMTTVASN
jgi:hypothetical protein